MTLSRVDYDPEDLAVHERSSDDEGHTVPSANREHYFEVGCVVTFYVNSLKY